MQTTAPLPIQRARAAATPHPCTSEMRKTGPAMGKDLVKVTQESEAWGLLTVSPLPSGHHTSSFRGSEGQWGHAGQEWAEADKGSCMSSVAEAGKVKGKKEWVR